MLQYPFYSLRELLNLFQISELNLLQFLPPDGRGRTSGGIEIVYLNASVIKLLSLFIFKRICRIDIGCLQRMITHRYPGNKNGDEARDKKQANI
jgi:hypothetical protein